jgi:cytochrome c oxidase assembly protein subunit 15
MIALLEASIATPPRPRVLGGRSRSVAIWLFVVAGFVYLMVVVGGATRLTGSGLSITEWKPVTGAVPPLDDRAWAEAFARYRASSQFRLINQGISLAEFKVLFWWEWSHRFLARWVGVVFTLPLLGFLAMGRIPERLRGRCFALLALGGLQGLVGWWMVQSGLEGRASVAPERLATHLGLALVLLGALVWTGQEAWAGETRAGYRRRDGWRIAALLLAAGVFVQCLMGALVAGNGAGLVDTDWPLMAGRWFPEDYWQGALWATLAHGRAAVQFNHRLVAYGLLIFTLILLARSWRSERVSRAITARLAVILGLMCLQAGLGIVTLMAGDPMWLALAHQANAALLLINAVSLAWRTRRA